MDFKIKKLCPNCSQYFTLPGETKTGKNCHLPLTLHCGHPICQNCLINIIKYNEPIECKVCHNVATLASTDATVILKKPHFIYETFPIHVHVLGELSMKGLQSTEKSQISDDNYFIDIRSILESNKNVSECAECREKTNKMCQNCGSALCESCFTEIHSKYQSFKKHVYKKIELKLEPNMCVIHKDKPISYYCQSCSKCYCIDCLMVTTQGENCKGHELVPISEMQGKFLEELKAISPKVDETLRRLSNTAVHIGHTLKSYEQSSNMCAISKLILDVQHHFSKLYATIQKHEYETIGILEKLKREEKESLLRAKVNVAAHLKKTQHIIDSISAVLTAKNVEEIMLSSILESAKEIQTIPWFLQKSLSDNNIKLTVQEDLCERVQTFVSIEIESHTAYSLVSVDEIVGDVPPAPVTIVYPPQLPRDIRELARDKSKQINLNPIKSSNVPKFIPKYGSMSSLNSVGSVNSQSKSLNEDSDAKRKTLQKGIQELVYISHIIDPHDFYVQLSTDQNLVKELIKTYRNSKSLPIPLSSEVNEGNIMLGYCEEEKKWHRCQIMSINKKNSGVILYSIFYIDFGITDHVTINQLRKLESSQSRNPFPLAYHCKLANLQPVKEKWSSEDAILMQKIVDNKQSVIYVRGTKKNNNNKCTYICDLVTFEEGVNLATALAFYDRGTLGNNKISCPNIKTFEEKPRIFYSINDYSSKKELYEVYVTSVLSPDHFYIRKVCLQDIYLNLSTEIASTYNLNNNNKDMIHCPAVGMICVVNVDSYEHMNGGGWRRARVRKLNGEQKVTLQLVDTGEKLIAHVSSLRKIQSQFTKLNALAVECHLHGVTPQNQRWSEMSLNLMRNFMETKLQLRMVTFDKNSLGVVLYGMSDKNEFLCINEEMVKNKFAITIGMTDFNLPEEIIHTNKNPLIKPVMRERKQNAIKVLNKNSKEQDIETVANDLSAKDKGPIKLEVEMIECQSPSLIYVTLKDQQKKMKDLYNSLQETYCSKQTIPSKCDWKVNDRCCAKCDQSKTWRRARIIEMDDEVAKLFFIDFAVIEKVALSELRVLLPKFTSDRDAAIKCHLTGIMPGAGENWPLLTIEHLKERISQYRRYFITKRGAIKDNSLPIELWVYHITLGGALEPNKAEWRCLNTDIIENGLAIPIRENETAKSNESDDGSLSFLDLTGSVNDWIQLESTLNESLKDTEEEEGATDDIIENSIKLYRIQPNEIVDTSDWLPSEPFTSLKFNGTVTYVDSSGVLYLHEQNQKDMLQLLKSAIDNVTNDCGDIKKGAICLARFYMDHELYRAKIIAVRPDHCIVLYVDFGNVERCSLQDIIVLSRATALHKIPIQAHKCVLAHIVPPNGSWTANTLKYIHQSLVDKKCYVKIVGKPIGEFIPIELKVENKYWVHEHLIEYDLAVNSADWTDFIQSIDDAIVDETDITDISNGSVDKHNSTSESFDINKDWNAMMDDESEDDVTEAIYVPTYKSNSFDKTTRCVVTDVSKVRILSLKLLHDEETEAKYAQMIKDIQNTHKQQPNIDGIYDRKACIALSNNDNVWHRAIIQQYSEKEERMRVGLVDNARSEIVPVANVKEIDNAWLVLPPGAIIAKLHGVEVNYDVEASAVLEQYNKVLLNNSYFMKAIESDQEPIKVELSETENGEPAYNDLIVQGVLIKDT